MGNGMAMNSGRDDVPNSGRDDAMTPEQRRAHLVLINQPLLDAWEARVKLCDEGGKLYDEGNKLWGEGFKLYSEGVKLYSEGRKLCDEGRKLWGDGGKLWGEGNKLWRDAVRAAYGDIEMTWENDYNSCTLANGERYGYDGHE